MSQYLDDLDFSGASPVELEQEAPFSADKIAQILTAAKGSFFTRHFVKKDPKTEAVLAEYDVTLELVSFIPLHQNNRRGPNAPAPGMVFSTYKTWIDKDGNEQTKPTLPIQYGGYAGGHHIDFVKKDKTLEQIVRWGYDRQLQKNGAPQYFNGCTAEYADFVFEAVGELLDSDEGREFRASLMNEAMIEKASEGRTERRGFQKILAVIGDHNATVRRSSSASTYAQVNAERTLARESGNATRTVETALPF